MKPNSAVPAALLLPALLLPALLTAGARGAAAQDAAQDAAPPIAVGRLALPPCVPDSGGYGGYCGALPVRLDRHGPGSDARTLSAGFEFYPHTGPDASAGLILALGGRPRLFDHGRALRATRMAP